MWHKSTLLYTASSQFGRYRVVDMTYNGRPARLLFGDEKSPQSGVALDDNPELLFDYNQRFMEIVASLRPRRVLIIGGGAFSLPMALIARYSDINVDVVELDRLLLQLARKFFEFKDNQRLNVFIQDGRKFLEKNQNVYDLIIVDAFSGLDIPRSLLSREAAALYRAALSPGGALAINFISAYEVTTPTLAHQLVATIKTEFNHVDIFPADYDAELQSADNLVLVASRGPIELPYLQSASLLPSQPSFTSANNIIHDSV